MRDEIFGAVTLALVEKALNNIIDSDENKHSKMERYPQHANSLEIDHKVPEKYWPHTALFVLSQAVKLGMKDQHLKSGPSYSIVLNEQV